MSEIVLEFDRVAKSYRTEGGTVTAVAQANGTIAQGDIVALFGPSGSGKSTLLNLGATVDMPDQGSVRLFGKDTKGLGEAEREELRARNLGFIFQGFNLLTTLTAVENVSLALVPTEPSSFRRMKRAKSALEEVGLGDRLYHLPKQLSGGQQQRVGIARALVKRPKIVFADEPSANLDRAATSGILQLVKEFSSKQSIAFLICTHDPDVVQAATKRWSMHDGRMSVTQ